MRKITLFIFGLFIFISNLSAQLLKANFTAKECTKEIYKQSFDSSEDFKGWTLKSTNTSSSWHLATKPNQNGIPPFTAINPDSKYSLAIWYDDRQQQNEVITSPEIVVPEGGICSFYTCFDGVFIFNANLTLVVTTETKEHELFNALMWAQESGHERAKWLPFSFDLSEYAGQKVKFSFKYKGIGGDDVLIDDFLISQKDLSGESPAEINEGMQIHFDDLSTGNPVSRTWVFEGGIPSTSTELNPVVTYQKAGTYPVKLTVNSVTESNVCERKGFVIVRSVAPTAIIGFPSEGYLSPWVACYLPLDTEVHFTDLSIGNPTSWDWQLQGSNKERSYEQNPVVTYPNKGLYSLSLKVSNDAGIHSDVYEHALQAGGEQYIWNIEMNESSNLAPIDLAFFGYYGGTNWLDMTAFAEHFDKPAQPGSISEVAIYFASIETVSPDAPITVSIAQAKDGLPGDILTSASIRADELKYSDETYEKTVFKFTKPAEVNNEFFVIISGFPNNSTDSSTDNISMFCSPRRKDGGKSTVYHQLTDPGEGGQLVSQWAKNEDEFLSFAITPLFAYKEKPSSIQNRFQENIAIYVTDGILHFEKEFQSVTIYTTTGQKKYTSNEPASSISVKGWEKGVYILTAVIDGTRIAQKVEF